MILQYNFYNSIKLNNKLKIHKQKKTNKIHTTINKLNNQIKIIKSGQ